MPRNVGSKPVWRYPEVAGYNPPERWGHSACCYDGVLYVFGGCCGGLHFSDVLTLDLKAMVWRPVETCGERPGTRDSHSAVVFGEKMIIFGGTNGSSKVNDLHMLNLQSCEWTRPAVQGTPPSPRESHSATLVGDGRVVIFGGSGEGEGNYLNDLHILDLKAMKWSSPDVSGEAPARRDSHTAVAIGNKLVVYGGDCGDHYLGEVDVLDLATFTWSRLVVEGSSSPGVRAGHVAVGIGSKVYVIGGVGDRTYYNDAWMLDMDACTWMELDVAGEEPQGRFSHTAVIAGSASILVYGGCGEDEHPLDEIVILQLGTENSEACHFFEKQRNQDVKPNFPDSFKCAAEENGLARDVKPGSEAWNDDLKRFTDAEAESKQHSSANPEIRRLKRRKKASVKGTYAESEQEQQSRSISQQSNSPSQLSSYQDQILRSTTAGAVAVSRSPHHPFGIFGQQTPAMENGQRLQQYGGNLSLYPHSPHVSTQHSSPKMEQHFIRLHPAAAAAAAPATTTVQLHLHVPPQGNETSPNPAMQPFYRENNNLRVINDSRRPEAEARHKSSVVAVPNLLGAEVRGVVDGVFDSGYLMTAHVTGQLFRGLLFSPAPGVAARELNAVPGYAPNGAGLVSAHNPLQASNPACLKAAVAGSPIVPNVPLGAVLQSAANFGRTAAAESGAPTIMVKSPVFPTPVDVQVRPTQDQRCSSRPNLLSSTCNGGISKTAFANSNGNVQTATSGHGQWVWHPGPGAEPPRRDNVHFVAHPLPGLSYVSSQPGNASLVRGSSVQLSGNRATIPELQGVTLRLGGSGPHVGNGGQKH